MQFKELSVANKAMFQYHRTGSGAELDILRCAKGDEEGGSASLNVGKVAAVEGQDESL